MVDPVDFLCCFLCFLACLLRVLRKYFSMAVCSNSSGVGVAVVASSPWKRSVAELTAAGDDAASKRPREDQSEEEDRRAPQPVVVDEDCQGDVPREDVVMAEEKVVVMRERGRPARIVIPVAADEDCKGDTPLEDVVRVEKKVVAVMRDRRRPARIVIPVVVDEDCKEDVPREDVVRVEKKVVVMRERRRPARIVIPVTEAAGFGVAEMVAETEADVGKEMEEEGAGYCLASRRGSHRQVMEDGYGVISDIHGDSKQAFFGVFDGHGGRAAVDFVSAKLGSNILTALDELKTNESDDQTVQLAIKEAYLTTDREFLSQGLGSGVCAATVLLKDGELHVANVGDCRVVLCRKATADALTDDHRAAREDERDRIENSRGFVTCRNGVWRVLDSLAVSRAIGDGSMKEWVISEPETSKIQLTPDCQFLILASDGLWDKVTNQEAVDVVSKQSDSMKSCKELIEMSCRRGNRDDVTVMVVHLEKFMNHPSG